MAEFLIQALNETAPQRYWRGDVINVYEDGRCTEPPAPGMVIVKVPGLEMATALQHREEWLQRIGFTVVSSSLTTDTFRLRVEATEYNPNSGIGRLTAGQVETFLGNWGATGITFANWSVTYDIVILDAIKSAGFWGGLDRTGLTLVETNYTQSTGNHRCRVNYSASALTPAQLKAAITNNGGAVVSESTTNKTITFDVTRATVRDRFETEVKRRVERMIVRRKYRISEAGMQWVEEHGGFVTISLGDYQTYTRNKLTE